MEALRETGVVLAAELRRFVRSAKGIVLVVLYGLGAGLGGLVFVWASRSVSANIRVQLQGQDLPPEMASQAKMQILALFYGSDTALLEYLSTIPLVVHYLFKTTFLFLPAFVWLVGFDQLAGELGTRSLRYVVLRARRGSVVAGKFLGQVVMVGSITLIMDWALFALAAVLTEDFPLKVGLQAMVGFSLVSLVYVAAYAGITAFFSSLFRVTWFALLVQLVTFFVFLMFSLAAKIWDQLAFITWAMPSHYEPMLVRPTLVETLPGMGAYVGFAVVSVAAAWLVMRLRDL